MNIWDDDPIRDAIAGDQDALSGLLQRHGPDLRVLLAAAIPDSLRSQIGVDDILQQTYTDAFLAITRMAPRGEGAFAAWLTTLAKCNLADALRSLGAEKRGGGAGRVEIDAHQALLDFLIADSDTPSRKAARAEARQTLLDALNDLPRLHRRVVREHDLEGRSIAEIAARLGRSPGAVHMLRARALRWLAQALGDPSRFFSHFA